jgi:hypothetical protein
MSSIRSKFSLISIIGLSFLGCGSIPDNTVSAAQTGCQANQAQIRVGDGFLQNLCGCAEASQLVFQPTTGFTCTVTHGSFLAFHFQGNTLVHQIIPVGSPALQASPIEDPKSASIPKSLLFQIPTAGTYLFQDAFNSQLFGTIIAL